MSIRNVRLSGPPVRAAASQLLPSTRPSSRHRKRLFRSAVAALGFLVLSAAPSLAQSTGYIAGTLTDATGRGINSATIQILTTDRFAISDAAGRFRLNDVPAGTYTLEIRSLGHVSVEQQMTVQAGQVTDASVELILNPMVLEGLVVQGQLGQSEAFNRQRTAASIQNVVSSEQVERFPDANIPGVLRRIPGVAAESDRGEPGAVYLRGLNPDLTTVTVNGQRLPATGSSRASSLTGISAEMIESLEVTKAVTPNMDADAVAGSVNIRTRGPTQRQVDGRMEGGLHSLAAGGNGRGSMFYSDRFDNLGVVVGMDYSRQNRETENVQTRWTDFEGQQVLSRLTAQAYPMERTRYSANSTLDYQFSPGNRLFVRGLAALYETYETRHTLAYRLDTGTRISATETEGSRFDREGRYTFNEQHVYNLEVGGEHLRSGFNLDYSLTAGMANGNQPFRDYFTYRQTGANLFGDASNNRFFPDVRVTNSADPLDPAGFTMDKYEERTNLRSDRNYAASFNVERPFNVGFGSGSLQFGAKHTARTKENDQVLVEYYPVGTTFFMDQVGATSSAYRRGVSQGNYSLGRVVDFERGYAFADANRALLEDDINDTRLDGDSNDYVADESVSSAYGMASTTVGKLTVLGGVRYEYTSHDYAGNRLIFDQDGDYEATIPVSSGSSYGNFFPSLHLRYALAPSTNLRASYTGTISRPSFNQLAPNELIENEDLRIRRGNPDLLPARAQNFDLLGEHYFESIGVLSAGLFFKQLSDFTFNSTTAITTGEYAGFDLVMPANGASATVYGLELGWQQQLAFLPAPFDGAGILANYTYTGSRTELGDQFDRPDTRFPRQVPHFGNLALSYDRAGFSGLASVNYQSAYMYSIASAAEEDRFTHKRAQFDMAVSQQLTPRFRAFLELNNLTNEPFITYTGTLDRPIESEYEGRWGMFGIRFDF
jgi:TonB-dependent receptor